MLLALALLSCSGKKKGDDFFWYRSAGADMPVWVRGKEDAKTFVVFIQGGPGNPTQMVDAMFPEVTKDLDENYRMVYFDQRASGVSVGNANPESLNIQQFADDLDLLIDILHERYDIEHLFLWGISWGGTLGNYYLLDPERQARIDGWIEMDGGENFEMAYNLSRPQIIDFAKAQITAGEREKYWKSALEYYAKHPDKLPPPPDNLQHFFYVYDAGGYFFDPDDGFDSFLPYFFSGPFGTTYFGNQKYVDKHVALDSINLHPQMSAITLPTLIIWGEEDLVVLVEVGRATFDAIGTPESDKTLVIIPETAHTVPNESPVETLEAMHTFISEVVQKN